MQNEPPSSFLSWRVMGSGFPLDRGKSKRVSFVTEFPAPEIQTTGR